MPRTKEITVYKFQELSPAAKDRVRHWLNDHDNDWWDYIYEDFIKVAECLGFEVSYRTRQVVGTAYPRPGGPTQIHDPEIYFSGNYGWTAGFKGRWRFLDATKAEEKIKEHASEDELLHRIARVLEEEMAKFACVGLDVIIREGDIYADISGNEHGIGDIEVCWISDYELTEEQEQAAYGLHATVEATAKDLARWLAKQLEEEDRYRYSDEYVQEMCEGNDYEFDEDGELV